MKTPLVVELDLSESLKIHLVFYINLWYNVANKLQPGQHQDFWEIVIILVEAKKLYVNCILGLNYDRQFKPPLLCYFVDIENDYSGGELFSLLTNC